MHLTVGAERIVQPHAVHATPAVDERDHVGPHVALFVKYVAAQARVQREGRVERRPQRGYRRFDLWRLGETPQLLSENDACHAAMMPRRCVTINRERPTP